MIYIEYIKCIALRSQAPTVTAVTVLHASALLTVSCSMQILTPSDLPRAARAAGPPLPCHSPYLQQSHFHTSHTFTLSHSHTFTKITLEYFYFGFDLLMESRRHIIALSINKIKLVRRAASKL